MMRCVLYNKRIIQHVFITIIPMSTKRFFRLFFISAFLSLVLPLSVLAQSGVPADNGTYVPPSIDFGEGVNSGQVKNTENAEPVFTVVATTEVQNALFEKQEGNVFIIGFDLKNEKGVQPEVQYAVHVFEEAKETGFTPRVLVDSKVYDETLTLVEGTPVHKSIEYTPPAFLKGNYDVSVFAFNAQSGLILGQTRVGIITFLGTGEKLQIDECAISSQEGQPVSGAASVLSGAPLTVTCAVSNTTENSISAVPVLETHKQSPFGDMAGKEKLVETTFTPGANTISLDFAAQSTAGVYNAILSFVKDDTDVSNEISLTYGIDGTIGIIKNATLDKIAYVKGDTANIFLFWTMIEESTKDDGVWVSRIQTKITNNKGKACGEPIEQTFEKGERTATIEMPIARDCTEPVVTVTLSDASGTVLDEATFHVNTGVPEERDYTILLMLLAVAILLGLLWYWKVRGNGTQTPQKTMMASVIFFAVLFGGFVQSADAATLTWQIWGGFDPNKWQEADLTISLNKSSYSTGETIFVPWTLNSYGTCCGKLILNESPFLNLQTKFIGIVNGQEAVGQIRTDAALSLSPISNTATFTAPGSAGSYNGEVRGTFIIDTGEEGTNGDPYGCLECWYAYRNLYIPYTVTAPVVPPTVWLTANPNPVDYNTTSNFNWGSSNATSCRYTTDGGANWTIVAVSGNIPNGGPFTSATTVTLECSGSGGTAQTSVIITIKPPQVVLTASPSSVAPGGSSTLNWYPTASALGLTSCNASGGTFTGLKGTSGSESTGALSATTLYSINCTGPAGSASASATVTVVVPPPVPTVTLTADNTTVAYNTATTLRWTSTSATSCTASNGWSGSKAIPSGNQSTGNLTTGRTYTLTCTNATGSAVASVTVNVGAAPPAPTVTLTATPASVAYGTASTLTWSSTDASSCTGTNFSTGGATNNTTGVSTGNLTTTTTYSITCSGTTSPPATTSATVTVGAAPPPLPTVTLSAAPNPINYNTASTLTWSSTNADSCTASGAWTGSKMVSGSLSTGNLTASQTYTLTCTNVTGSANRSVTVTVNAPTPDFSLSKSNDIEVTIVGGVPSVSSKSTVTVDAVGSFANAIDLSVVSIAPAVPGIGYTFSRDPLNAGDYTTGSLFSVTVPGTTASGTSIITIQGIGGGLTRTVNIILKILGKDPEFENF